MKVKDFTKIIETEFGEELKENEYSEDEEYHDGYSKEYDFDYLTGMDYDDFIRKGENK